MWSFRKKIHKLSLVTEKEETIPCAGELSFNGARGVFLFEVDLGTATGEVELTYDAYGKPDRFIIEFDGNVVADSKYVGDDLVGNPPDTAGFVGETFYNLPENEWDGTGFVANGNTRDITINQSDVASSGETSGTGTIKFTKTNSTPTKMQVTILAPKQLTAWNIITTCPTEV